MAYAIKHVGSRFPLSREKNFIIISPLDDQAGVGPPPGAARAAIEPLARAAIRPRSAVSFFIFFFRA
ncbi:MAG: hypothetical protein H3C55_06995 [Pseudorhodoplanes sp.]|nr:hypothetical protein [Pseudorhodoplanes sp.]